MADEMFLEEARLRSLIKAGGARRIRLEAGISLAELGQMAGGVGANTVCRWERGEQSPRGVDIGLYAQALGKLRAATRAGRRQAKAVAQ
jgi:transcriptional regulator with XRE-family HTH domain